MILQAALSKRAHLTAMLFQLSHPCVMQDSCPAVFQNRFPNLFPSRYTLLGSYWSAVVNSLSLLNFN